MHVQCIVHGALAVTRAECPLHLGSTLPLPPPMLLASAGEDSVSPRPLITRLGGGGGDPWGAIARGESPQGVTPGGLPPMAAH